MTLKTFTENINVINPNRVIIGYIFPPDYYDIDDIFNVGGNIHYQYDIINAMSAIVPADMIERLKMNPNVKYIETPTLCEAFPTYNQSSYQHHRYQYQYQQHHQFQQLSQQLSQQSSQQVPWGISKIKATEVHPTNKGTGIKVGIFDTGIDYNHEDLSQNYKGGHTFMTLPDNGTTNCKTGQRVDNSDPIDQHGHGTHVAGIIGAVDNTVGVIGVAPEADLYAIKVLNKNGNGCSDNIIAGLNWAKDNNIEVMSASLGWSLVCCGGSNCDCEAGKCLLSNPGQALIDSVRALYDVGIPFVCAAGNNCGCGCHPEGRIVQTGSCNYTSTCGFFTSCPEKCDETKDWISYPARIPEAIAVGAIDSNNEIAYFSNPGPSLVVTAPGVDVLSTVPKSANKIYDPSGYKAIGGTSMATPHVTGTVALMKKVNSNLTPDQIKQILKQTAVDIGPVGFDWFYGAGLVDAKAAVDAAGDGTICPYPSIIFGLK